MKTQLTQLEMIRMYKSYYSDVTSKVKQVSFSKRKETVVQGTVSWVELSDDSDMYKLKVLIGREVM